MPQRWSGSSRRRFSSIAVHSQRRPVCTTLARGDTAAMARAATASTGKTAVVQQF
jgi:hypothetical protein